MATESLKNKRARAARVVEILRATYGEVTTTLDHESAFELLVSTVLAAQCTDAKVNTVTPHLFDRWPTPEALAAADPAELEQMIHPLGFFRQKTKSLIALSQDIVSKFGGKVPDNMEGLTSLRGVGRKTANVVLGDCFEAAGIVVDTHCNRVSNRLGFTTSSDPVKIELDLMKVVERKDWALYGHLLVWHGRAVCTARKPRCPDCPVLDLCPTGLRLVADKGR